MVKLQSVNYFEQLYGRFINQFPHSGFHQGYLGEELRGVSKFLSLRRRRKSFASTYSYWNLLKSHLNFEVYQITIHLLQDLIVTVNMLLFMQRIINIQINLANHSLMQRNLLQSIIIGKPK